VRWTGWGIVLGGGGCGVEAGGRVQRGVKWGQKEWGGSRKGVDGGEKERQEVEGAEWRVKGVVWGRGGKGWG